jgi:hypothetical protein
LFDVHDPSQQTDCPHAPLAVEQLMLHEPPSAWHWTALLHASDIQMICPFDVTSFTGPAQALWPWHSVRQLGASQFTAIAQLLVPEQMMSQISPARQSTLPAHAFCPVHCTSQACESHLMLP